MNEQDDVREVDVIVVGGGMAGTCAAIAAARNGARTILVEKLGFLGGNASGGLLGNFYSFHNMKGDRVTRGISQEIVDRLIEVGGAFPDNDGSLPNNYGSAGTFTPVDSELLKLVLQRMCVEAGVNVWVNTFLSAVSMKSDDEIDWIRVVNKSGEQRLRAKAYIDSSGDADLVARAGGSFLFGDEQGRTMSISLFFRMANIDFEKHLEFVKSNPEQFMLGEDPFMGMTKAEVAATLKTYKDFPLMTGYYDAVRDAQAAGKFHKNRQRVILSISPQHGVGTINATSALGYNPVDEDDLTRAAFEAREQIPIVADFLRENAPGFENAVMMDSASHLGVRESRRIVGDEMLTDEWCLAGTKSDRDIARGCVALDVHKADGTIEHWHIRGGESYGIPIGCLIPKDLKRVIVAGRCLSSERFAHGSARNQVSVQHQGEAAGIAAAIASAGNSDIRDVEVSRIRDRLQSQNQIV